MTSKDSGDNSSANLLNTRRLVAHALNVSVEGVHQDTSIDSLDSWDSMGHLRIVFAIEERIGVELTVEQILSIESVEDVAELLQL